MSQLTKFFGYRGAKFVLGNTSTHAGPFFAIKIINDTVFSDINFSTSDYEVIGAGLSSVTFPAGFVIEGQIESFSLTTGAVIAYLRGPQW